MKAMELLIESPRDQIALERIATEVSAYVYHNRSRILDKGFISGKLKDIVPSSTLSHLYGRLRATDIVIFRDGHASHSGSYNSFAKTVKVYLEEYVNVQQGAIEWKDRRGFEGTVIHEFRHRLDHSLSGDVGFRSATSTSSEYLKKESEINARIAEVMFSLNRDLRKSMAEGNTMTINEYIDRFKFYGAKRDLLKIFSDASNEELNNWSSMIENGMFGRPVSVDMAGSILAHNSYRFNIRHPKYKRILTRLYKMYEHIVRR